MHIKLLLHSIKGSKLKSGNKNIGIILYCISRM